MPKSTKISYFNNVTDNEPQSYDLDEWLSQTIKPPKDLKKKILRYRETKNQSLKRKIPCVTISASFKKVRNLDNIKQKNEFIVLDIDREAKAKNRPSNTCIDMQKVKEFLSKHPSTYYCGSSIGNDGIYCIIKIKKSVSLLKYFKYLRKTLIMNGIFIDESCKDYTRLRIFSYDPDAFYNPEAKTLILPKKVKVKKKKTNHSADFKSNFDRVESVVQLIESNAIDITSDYSDWVKVAGSLYNAFGEEGRQFFHRISRYHHDYKPKTADRKFDQCRNMKKLTLSSFFFVADSYGIRY